MKDDFTGKSIPNIDYKDYSVSWWKIALVLFFVLMACVVVGIFI